MAFRTASYAEAQRNAAQGDSSTGAVTYRGNIKRSQEFFRKMGESHAEAERLRQQCRAAASQSTGKREEVKVSFLGPGLERDVVEHAKAMATFAKGATVNVVGGCKQAVRDYETSRVELQSLEQARTKALNTKCPDERDKQALEFPIDTTAAERAELHAKQKLREERDKLGEIGMGAFWDATGDAPHGRFIKLEHLSLPQDLKSKWKDDATVQSLSSTARSQGYAGAPEAVPKGQLASDTMQVMQGLESGEEGVQSPQSLRDGDKPAPKKSSSQDLTGAAMAIDNPGTADLDEGGDAGFAGPSINDNSEKSSSDDSDFEETESEESDAWPPSPPVLRFKMRMQFSNRFKPTDPDTRAAIQELNESLDAQRRQGVVADENTPMKDPVLGWLNLVFQMNVENEYQFEVGFPIIILTMLDAIYPKRVRWREIDWRFQYKRALEKNFAVLEAIWSEVNMEKAREFRVENTPLRMENLPHAPLSEKLEFLRLMKRWYDQRIHHAGPYDPMAKRVEFVEQCKTWGQSVKFPPWIFFTKDHQAAPSDRTEEMKQYDKMPEYKRLIHFLGCQQFQTM